MGEPTQNRDHADLAPLFRAPYEAWLTDVQAQIRHVKFVTIETRRTFERQQWLYAQGRTPPHEQQPRITWTLDSRHRWGLAADWIMVRPNGSAIWSVQSYQWVYEQVPPDPYGIKHIAPLEWMHVEYRFADEAIIAAADVSLEQA